MDYAKSMNAALISLATLAPFAWFFPSVQAWLEQSTYQRHFED